MLSTFILLGAAICAVWIPAVRWADGDALRLWQPLFVAAVVAGLLSGVLWWPALFALAALWIVALLSRRTEWPRPAGWLLTAAVLLALAFPAHLLPGFNYPVVASDLQLTAKSAPMTVTADFDKGAAGLIFLAYVCERVRRLDEWPKVVATGVGVGLATAVVVVGAVAFTGFIDPDPKLPRFALVWVPMNLFLTCVLEEAVFRGVFQERLAVALSGRQQWRWVAVALPSVLFGAAHAHGGPLLVAAATVAGVGYGLAYAATRRIEAAILAHFTLNAVHFFGFTYPYAVR